MARRSKGADRVLVQNAVKTLVANIRFASVDNPVTSIVVTSSVPNEGKSSISVALAQAMAQGGKDVLLVECDMRHRTLASLVGAHPTAGLYAVLAGQESLRSVAVETSTAGLWFLDAEPHIPNPVDILASRRFRQFVRELNGEYDYVVLDTPPLSAVVDGAVVGAVADATILVVRENYARREDVTAAYDQLRKAGANVIGAVMNYCDNDKGDYYYDYYYGRDAERAAGVEGEDGRDADDAMSGTVPQPIPSHASAPAGPQAASAQGEAVPAPAAPGLRSIPVTSPDSTAQFLAGTAYQGAAYQPRDYEE